MSCKKKKKSGIKYAGCTGGRGGCSTINDKKSKFPTKSLIGKKIVNT